jgi:hypothetical protein
MNQDNAVDASCRMNAPIQQTPRQETVWTIPCNPALRSLPTANLTIHSYPNAIQVFVRRNNVDCFCNSLLTYLAVSANTGWMSLVHEFAIILKFNLSRVVQCRHSSIQNG